MYPFLMPQNFEVLKESSLDDIVVALTEFLDVLDGWPIIFFNQIILMNKILYMMSIRFFLVVFYK